MLDLGFVLVLDLGFVLVLDLGFVLVLDLGFGWSTIIVDCSFRISLRSFCISNTEESNASKIFEYSENATNKAVFFSFNFDKYSFERSKLAEAINSGISGTGRFNPFNSSCISWIFLRNSIISSPKFCFVNIKDEDGNKLKIL